MKYFKKKVKKNVTLWPRDLSRDFITHHSTTFH